MASPARFLFDTDFAAPPPAPEPAAPAVPTIEVSAHEALLAAAEAAAFDRGFAAGRGAEEARQTTRLAEEATRLVSVAQSILAVLDADRARVEADAARVATMVGTRIAGRLIELHPEERILALVSEALAPLRKAPHLVIRMAAEDAGSIRGALDRIVQERGFEGRLVVLGEPDIARGDCRIEWADGGIVLDRAATEAAIAQALDTHLALIAPAPADDPAERS
ncbi:FliH/SctL family protein [Chthonobacter rhizosphaerae]|uniref:FliH/SctL family protein n=1 Tax=Chthonobacter rhizosphaerae TaxID=2735553 RepID=UPI0015EF8589|nr:FliH/SctL family protein [Chthonobacter rhizosphaerae]